MFLAPYVRDPCRVFDALYAVVPPRRQRLREELSAELDPGLLSDGALARLAERDGRIEFATLGRGNHFLELQRAEDGELWLVAHSGSRCMGPAIRDHHLARTGAAKSALVALHVDSEEGQRYLRDHAWALRYAQHSRRRMLQRAAVVLEDELGLRAEWSSFFDSHHNLVRREEVEGEELWVHRKGALPARLGERGVIPGSMGDASFHVEGRGCAMALHSSSHGAGRSEARGAAARHMSLARFARELEGTLYDERLAARLLDEAPSAYKPIGAVMRAQRELTRIVRRLSPILVVKAT
jgi:tRNA-splicing ligase RtcB